MRFQPWMLLVAGTIAVVAATVFAAIAMGGDDTPASADTTTPTVTTTAANGTTTPAQTPDNNELGPAPVMTAHVTDIIPKHGGQIKQAATREKPSSQSGICAVVSYKDLPENNQWFRMAVDDQEVTQKLTIIALTKEGPEGATMCYAPKEGLSVGRHSAAIIVQNPRVTSGPPQETVAWKFDVVE